MKLWDGIEYVPHGGIVFKGERNVIEYAGLTATPDHKVWSEHHWRTHGECAASGKPISCTGIEGKAVREADGYFRYGSCQGGVADSQTASAINAQTQVWDYGGRGIRFCFDGPTDMALWLMERFDCTDRRMQIDRIDNNGNYEPGNVRMTTPSINGMNRRHQLKVKMLRFRQEHPEVRYADATLCNLISRGFSNEEIVERFNSPSCKPKGVYGTFSTPDPAIVSQLMVY